MTNDFFNKIFDELHQNKEQLKRLKSSTSAKLTPVSIDTENKSGIFKGSEKIHTMLLLIAVIVEILDKENYLTNT